MSDATHKAEKGTWLGLEPLFIDFRLELKWLQTLLDSRKRTREYFKSNSSFFILKYFYKWIRTPASIRTTSPKSSTILSEQRVETAERIT